MRLRPPLKSKTSCARSTELLFCGVAAFPATGPASSQDWHPDIIGEDDQVRVEEQGPPWDAIGQVNISVYRMTGRCASTLAAPDLVPTAALCVIDPWRKAPFPLHHIHFLAGVRAAQHKGHSVAKCRRSPKGYKLIGPEKILPRMAAQNVPLRAIRNDVVAIVPHKWLALDPVQLAEGVLRKTRLRLLHAAYPADRRFMLSAHSTVTFYAPT